MDMVQSPIRGTATGYPPRMAKSLSLLRQICTAPGTDEALIFDEDFNATDIHGKRFRSVRGVPVLRDEPPDLKKISASHITPGISDDLIDHMLSMPGYTLLLGGGNTPFSYSKVVDVEFNLHQNTDVVADAHELPFKENTFDLFLAMNVFEHLRHPFLAANEIFRVLKPGGELHIHTAFLQPLHEEPVHFFNATEFGVREWLRHFEHVRCEVTPNFNPLYSIAWLADEIQRQVASESGGEAATEIGGLTLAELANFWRQPEGWNPSAERIFRSLSEQTQRRIAAGFDFKARKPEA